MESIDEQKSECLNEADNHTFSSALHGGGGYLESECDEQVRVFVEIHSFLVQSHLGGRMQWLVHFKIGTQVANNAFRTIAAVMHTTCAL